MDRNVLAARLALDFDPLLVYAALDDSGTKALWDQVIGDAYAAMGYTVPPDPEALTGTQSADLPYLLDFYALRTITRRMGAQAYVHTPEITHKWELLFDHAKALLADAEAAVEARGYPVTHAFALGRLQLDFLEPNLTTGVPPSGFF